MRFAALIAASALLSGCGWLGARGRDVADCFKANVGVGLGLAADVHLTEFVSPGLGVASYTWNFGYDERLVCGTWIESDVINTPRLAYEALAQEYQEASAEQLDEGMFVARLAISSLNLPNERWIRYDGRVTVQYFSLFNFGDIGQEHRARSLTGHLLQAGDEAIVPERSVWQRGFFAIGVTAGVVHVRAGVNPLEVVDLLLGFFGLDPAGDDR